MATWSQSLKHFFTANNGEPLVGGLLYTYAAGTTTAKTAFKDAAHLVPHTNPIVLDARGEELIYWAGSYKAVLCYPSGKVIWTVDNITGNGLTVSIPDTVELPPIANFTYAPPAPTATANITATNTSTRLTGSDSYEWRVNGGPVLATTANLLVTFDIEGTYVLSMKVSNEWGSDTKTSTIVIGPSVVPTVTDITYTPSTNITSDNPVSFTPVFSGAPSSYAWTFKINNVTVGTSTNPLPTFTFPVPGVARVELRLTGAAGVGPIYGEDIGVVTVAPIVSFTAAPKTGVAPLLVTIDNITANLLPSDQFDWDFGDGQSTTVEEPVSHTYTVPGSYVLALRVFRNGFPFGPTSSTITVTSVVSNRLVDHVSNSLVDHLGNFIAHV